MDFVEGAQDPRRFIEFYDLVELWRQKTNAWLRTRPQQCESFSKDVPDLEKKPYHRIRCPSNTVRDPNRPSLSLLPDDILYYVFSMCSTRDLCKWSLVSQQMAELVMSDHLWRDRMAQAQGRPGFRPSLTVRQCLTNASKRSSSQSLKNYYLRVVLRHLNEDLFRACLNCDAVEIIACLERGADPDGRAPGGPSSLVSRGESTLHTCLTSRSGRDVSRSLLALLDRGAHLEARMNEGWTPLHCAVFYDRQEAVPELLRRGANVHARDVQGQTPLHLCAARGHGYWLTKELITYGADPNVADHKGRTPLNIYTTKRYGLDSRVKTLLLCAHETAQQQQQQQQVSPTNEVLRPACIGCGATWHTFEYHRATPHRAAPQTL